MKARRDSFASINREVYMTPAPEVVARLVDQYGADAASERWHWIDARSLGNLARTGRARLGTQSQNAGKKRSSDPAQEAAAVEVAFLVGSGRAGERAAGMGVNSLMYVLQERGLADMPRLQGAARGENSRDGMFAKRGDADAAARIEARLEHERDLYAVMRAALALVPEQPATGRYVLPEISPALAAALAGHPPDAVDRAFPGLLPRGVEEPVVDAEWEAAAPPAESPAIPAQESVMNLAPRARSVPSDAAIRAHHAETPKAADLAARWGVSTACVYQHLRRLGLGRLSEAPVPALPAPAPAPEAPATNVVAFAPPPCAPAPPSTEERRMARYNRRDQPDYTHLRGKSPEQVFAETYAKRAPGEHSGWWPERVNRNLIALFAERETLHVREAAAVYGAMFAKEIHTPEFTADRAANLLAWGVRLGILRESVEAGRYVWRMPDRELMWEVDPKGRARQIRGLPDGEQADMNRKRAAQARAADTRARKSAAALAPRIEEVVDALILLRARHLVPDDPRWREALPNALLPSTLAELRPMLVEAHHAMDTHRQRQWLATLETMCFVLRSSRDLDHGRPRGQPGVPLPLDRAPAPVHVPDLEDLCADDAAALAGL